MWEKLVSVLTDMLEVYQSVLELSKQKKETLVKGKAQDLEVITKREELLIMQVGKLDIMRKNALKEVAAFYNIKAETLSLSTIKKLADQAVALKLEEIDQKFNELNQELQPINELNTRLIQQTLGYINYSINVLTQSTASSNYAAKGHVVETGTAPRVLIDRKI